MNSPDLVIFGCDGVLVDSERTIARVRSEILASAGIELGAELLMERFAGVPFRDVLLTLERENGTPLQASLIEKVERRTDERLRREATATEGARRAVAAFPRRCICSNAPRGRVDAVLERTGLAALFSGAVFTADEIAGGRPKPAPDLFLHAARTMAAAAEESFVIEDSAAGVGAGLAAGMRVIGFTGATHSFPGHADVLTEAGAETVISRWNVLPQVVAALGDWR